MLKEYIDGFTYFPDAGKAKLFLLKLMDRAKLKSINLEETTSADGDNYNFSLEYDFENNKVLSYVSGWESWLDHESEEEDE